MTTEWIVSYDDDGNEIVKALVRCKDCRHYNAGFECLIEGYGIERNPDWFCADGKARQDIIPDRV